jgi:hypothetical protein
MICNLEVGSSSLPGGFRVLGFPGTTHLWDRLPQFVGAATVCVPQGEYPSGQRGQTVNLLAYAFTGSNPVSPIEKPAFGGFFNGAGEEATR